MVAFIALRFCQPSVVIVLVHAITYPEVHFSEPLHPILATIIAAAVKPREYPSVRIPAGAQARSASGARPAEHIGGQLEEELE